MLDSVVNELTKEIINFEMPANEGIIAGVDSRGAHIYVLNNTDVNCRDATGFAAIGIGYWQANSQFMFAGHNPTKPLPETLLLTLAAKKRAEVAPGVGTATETPTPPQPSEKPNREDKNGGRKADTGTSRPN